MTPGVFVRTYQSKEVESQLEDKCRLPVSCKRVGALIEIVNQNEFVDLKKSHFGFDSKLI